MKTFSAFSLLLLGMLMVVVSGGSAEAAKYRVLYSFGASPGDGYYPTGAIYRDNAGNIYGTTLSGGASQNAAQPCKSTPEYFCGTVFKITHDGVETLLYSFQGQTDGRGPGAGLVSDGAGNLYGTTGIGGGGSATGGAGTLFKITPEGDFTVLHAFKGGATGAAPGSLLFGNTGNLYGIAANGYNKPGIALELSTSGQVLFSHTFGTGQDGSFPSGNLVQDHAGNVYGTTLAGGLSCGTTPADVGGTIFKIDTQNVETAVFLDCFSQNLPTGLAIDGSHNLYGVSVYGANSTCNWDHRTMHGPCGSVFKVSADGNETTLHKFIGRANDGRAPSSGPLAIDKEGNLYGFTSAGGTYDQGTIYKMSKEGAVTVLWSFAHPIFPNFLMMDNKGHLYGTAEQGGAHHKGMVFMLDPNAP